MTNTPKWTPGPWEVDDVAGCKSIRSAVDGDEVVYTVGRADEEEDAANANLIAAAPNLYAICWAMLHREKAPGGGTYDDALRAALAKARGDQ